MKKIKIVVAVALLSFLNAKKAQFKRKTLRSPGAHAVICPTAQAPCDILQPKKLIIKGSFTNSRFATPVAIGKNFFVERAHLVKMQISLFLSHSCTNNSNIFSRSKYDCLTDYSFVCRHVNALSTENYPSLSLSLSLTHTYTCQQPFSVSCASAHFQSLTSVSR